MATLETWAIVFGAVPGYVAILGGLYTFLSKRGKRWVRRWIGLSEISSQGKKLDQVRSELQAMKAIAVAQAQTVNALAATMGANVDNLDPEDVPVIKTDHAEDVLYSETEFSPDDFIDWG